MGQRGYWTTSKRGYRLWQDQGRASQATQCPLLPQSEGASTAPHSLWDSRGAWVVVGWRQATDEAGAVASRSLGCACYPLTKRTLWRGLLTQPAPSPNPHPITSRPVREKGRRNRALDLGFGLAALGRLLSIQPGEILFRILSPGTFLQALSALVPQGLAAWSCALTLDLEALSSHWLA